MKSVLLLITILFSLNSFATPCCRKKTGSTQVYGAYHVYTCMYHAILPNGNCPGGWDKVDISTTISGQSNSPFTCPTQGATGNQTCISFETGPGNWITWVGVGNINQFMKKQKIKKDIAPVNEVEHTGSKPNQFIPQRR
jgi:hypothetical protein